MSKVERLKVFIFFIVAKGVTEDGFCEQKRSVESRMP